ncbi:MAG: zinc-ribbon domain-containing protein [Pelagibacteraceae bacterium]
MIIECINCNKKFEVDPDLIPEKGRSIQCGSCGHKWFYKKDLSEPSSNTDNEINNNEEENQEITISKDNTEKLSIHEEINEEKNINEVPKEDKFTKKSNIFNKIISYLIVIIISFVALIIVLDTFKTPLSNIFPNLEIILFNLYETFEDIGLFLKDLIK